MKNFFKKLWQRWIQYRTDPHRINADFSEFNKMTDTELVTHYNELFALDGITMSDRFRRLSLVLALRWVEEHKAAMTKPESPTGDQSTPKDMTWFVYHYHLGTGEFITCPSFESAMKHFEGFNIPVLWTNGQPESIAVSCDRVRAYFHARKVSVARKHPVIDRATAGRINQ